MYRTWCKYYPEYVNPITGRRGRYLTVQCEGVLLSGSIEPWVSKYRYTGKLLVVATITPKRPGSVINPTKELKAAIASGARLRPLSKMPMCEVLRYSDGGINLTKEIPAWLPAGLRLR